MPMVMKFGGTSVADAAAFENVARIVAAEREALPVVVVSAMSGVTDSLLAATVDSTVASLKPAFDRHNAVAKELLSESQAVGFVNQVSTAAEHAGELLRASKQNPAQRKILQDAVVSLGEMLSSALLAEVLNQRGIQARQVDARRCIITDEQHTCAEPLMAETFSSCQRELRPVLEANVVPVLGGFIGATTGGATTTLGRGGSDYTAAIVGAALRAPRNTDLDRRHRSINCRSASSSRGANCRAPVVQRSSGACLLRRESPAPKNNSTGNREFYSGADLQFAIAR